jgi:hypothetical protein
MPPGAAGDEIVISRGQPTLTVMLQNAAGVPVPTPVQFAPNMRIFYDNRASNPNAFTVRERDHEIRANRTDFTHVVLEYRTPGGPPVIAALRITRTVPAVIIPERILFIQGGDEFGRIEIGDPPAVHNLVRAWDFWGQRFPDSTTDIARNETAALTPADSGFYSFTVDAQNRHTLTPIASRTKGTDWSVFSRQVATRNSFTQDLNLMINLYETGLPAEERDLFVLITPETVIRNLAGGTINTKEQLNTVLNNPANTEVVVSAVFDANNYQVVAIYIHRLFPPPTP